MAKNTDSIEVRATAKYVRVAPRKARAVVALVRVSLSRRPLRFFSSRLVLPLLMLLRFCAQQLLTPRTTMDSALTTW